jgi:hypothetical protein
MIVVIERVKIQRCGASEYHALLVIGQDAIIEE